MQIDNIQEIKELREKLEGLESKILKPTITDFTHIPLLFDWYKSITREVKDFYRSGSTEDRQVYLFVILMLYCPRSLSGGFMIYGLRQRLAMQLGLSPTHISNMIKNISFFYKKYGTFRDSCDMVLSEIQKRIDNRILKLIKRRDYGEG